MDKLLTTHEKGVAERMRALRFEASTARLRNEIDKKREAWSEIHRAVEVKGGDYCPPDVGEHGLSAVAIGIIKVMDGLTLREVKQALRLTEVILCQTHFVDVSGEEFQRNLREYFPDSV